MIRLFIILFGIFLTTFHIQDQFRIITKYTKESDARIDYLLSLNEQIKKDTLILLKPLPPSGMIYSTEIATDTNHFTNKELVLGYALKFHVAKQQE